VGRADRASEKGGEESVRYAEPPDQTLNVDLCFVPAMHTEERKLPAVSGSSGRLVIERLSEDGEREEADWPGRVFEDENLDYAEAMQEFVRRSQKVGTEAEEDVENASVKAQKRALRQEEDELRTQRRVIRQQRTQEDAAWKGLREQHKQEKGAPAKLPPAERQAQAAHWRQLRYQRRATLRQREQEDELWREKRRSIRARQSQLPLVTAWIAILVITDNCTRQCLGLPLFIAGAKVTVEMIVEALRVLLPPELQFLISDRGTHFTANAFKILAKEADFIHVLIARHRPQSNGIAERFVQTLKVWLRDKSWQTDEELSLLLAQFLAEYNDRPHQGLPLPGLSPNEFAKRIWLM
jgi:transposase InsO family protein